MPATEHQRRQRVRNDGHQWTPASSAGTAPTAVGCPAPSSEPDKRPGRATAKHMTNSRPVRTWIGRPPSQTLKPLAVTRNATMAAAAGVARPRSAVPMAVANTPSPSTNPGNPEPTTISSHMLSKAPAPFVPVSSVFHRTAATPGPTPTTGDSAIPSLATVISVVRNEAEVDPSADVFRAETYQMPRTRVSAMAIATASRTPTPPRLRTIALVGPNRTTAPLINAPTTAVRVPEAMTPPPARAVASKCQRTRSRDTTRPSASGTATTKNNPLSTGWPSVVVAR